MEMQNKSTWLKDVAQTIAFIATVVVSVFFINAFVFQSFDVQGKSMQDTLQNGDRLIVDRTAASLSSLRNEQYVPERGKIIVFKNPLAGVYSTEQYLVKRVIAFAGERVVLRDGKYTVYNAEYPQGFNPDSRPHDKPRSPTSGSVDVIVSEGTLFVSGDHRDGGNSFDSRNGLGFVPLHDVVGPVVGRLFPFQDARTF